jgi:hypothetical protein
MKVILSSMLFVMLVFMSSCGQAQNNTSEKQISMLKEFYISYNDIWSAPPKTIPYDVLANKADSLNSIYCTVQLRKKAKEWLEEGHDLITNDYSYGDMVPKTLSVIKDSTKSNEYIVSYTAHDTDPYGKEYTQQVTLHVTVIKEGESYKIDSVR